MVGRAIQNEPTTLMVLDQARAILKCPNWLKYLNKLQGFHKEMTLELLQKLQNGSTTVGGGYITISEVVIAKFTGLPTKGENWEDKHILLHNVVIVFQDPVRN